MVVVARPLRQLWAAARRRPPARGGGEGLSLAALLTARRGARRVPSASVRRYFSRYFVTHTSAERLLQLFTSIAQISSVLQDASIILQRAGFAPESLRQNKLCKLLLDGNDSGLPPRNSPRFRATA